MWSGTFGKWIIKKERKKERKKEKKREKQLTTEGKLTICSHFKSFFFICMCCVHFTFSLRQSYLVYLYHIFVRIVKSFDSSFLNNLYKKR